MSKAKLVVAVRESVENMTIAASKAVVDAIYAGIVKGIQEDGEFYLDGIGTLKTSTRPARTGRNPQTGVAIQIGEKKLLKFKSARGIKALLNEPKGKKAKATK